MNKFVYEFSIGNITISENMGKITNVYFSNDQQPDDLQMCETPILKEAARQIDCYLRGELKTFSIPLEPHGTEFMKKVWSDLCEIPYGKTATYKDIAEKVGVPKGARAVGLANNHNPIPIFIPCHRVIGTNGALTGYRGGLEIKKILLELER